MHFIKDYWATLEPFTDGYYKNEVGDPASILTLSTQTRKTAYFTFTRYFSEKLGAGAPPKAKLPVVVTLMLVMLPS